MIRRITTGLVCIALARTSEVTGPPCSAMCSRTWSTPDNRLSGLMQLIMLQDGVKVKDRIVVDPEILGGKPVVRGTRIPVELVLKRLAHDLNT